MLAAHLALAQGRRATSLGQTARIRLMPWERRDGVPTAEHLQRAEELQAGEPAVGDEMGGVVPLARRRQSSARGGSRPG